MVSYSMLFGWIYERSSVIFQNVPPDLAICVFILEQSLSVRALQEMLSHTSEVKKYFSSYNNSKLNIILNKC